MEAIITRFAGALVSFKGGTENYYPHFFMLRYDLDRCTTLKPGLSSAG